MEVGELPGKLWQTSQPVSNERPYLCWGGGRTDSWKFSSDLHDIMHVCTHTLIVVIRIKDSRPQNNCGDVNHLDLAEVRHRRV